MEQGSFELQLIQLRQFAVNAYGQVDDYPYGGEPGLVLRPEPWEKAMNSLGELPKGTPVIHLTPQGKPLHQDLVKEWAKLDEMVLLCGHYKGIDERVIDAYVTHEISIGDYVLSGGELPAMVLLDAVIRLIPGVLGDIGSAETDSHHHGLLGWPVYTRPETWLGRRVPETLTSGHHAKIAAWRQEQAELRTQVRRPELFAKWRDLNPLPTPKKKKRKANPFQSEESC
jgi:tRNA (guanine37-N1)-methyltransferase